MKRPILRGLCVALALSTLGCKDPDFGDKALRFVRNDLLPLSRALAQADLQVRWRRSYQILLLDVGARLENISSVMKLAEHDSTQLSGTTNFSRLGQARTIEGVLVRVLDEFEKSSVILRSADAMCSSRELYDRFGLNMLGAVAVLQSIQPVKPDISVVVAFGDGSEDQNEANLITSIIKLFESEKVEAQNRKLREAIQLAPERIVKDDELFRLSNEACEQAKTLAAHGLTELHSLRKSVGDAIEGVRRLVALRRSIEELEGISTALGFKGNSAIETAVLLNELTGAGTELRGRLRLEVILAVNALLNAKLATDRSTAATLRAEQGRIDRELLLAFFESLRVSGLIAALKDPELEALLVRQEAQVRRLGF